MIQALTQTDCLTKKKIKLSVSIIVNLMDKGLRQVDIARACNVTKQSVNDYIQRHYDEIVPLIGDNDKVIAIKAKQIANKALDKINDIIDVTDDFSKRDIVPLSTTVGINIDKYRLLSDKSTSNVSVDQRNTNISELEAELVQWQAKKKVKRT